MLDPNACQLIDDVLQQTGVNPVRRLPGAEDTTLVAAIVAMSRAISLEVTAEGIETRKQHVWNVS